MRAYIFYITLLVSFTCSIATHAQIVVDEQLTDDDSDDTTGVVIHADPRLDIIFKKYRNTPIGYIYSGRGYRVQIYNGNDRVKANEIKVDFIRRFPGVRTYLTYVQPQFRVKVGDFRTRGDAAKLFEQTSAIYNACMIVPDIVVINTMKDDQRDTR